MSQVLGWRVDLGSANPVTAALDTPANSSPDTLLILAHGAGGHMADRGMLAVSSALVKRGLAVFRFNFPYREKDRAPPDRMPVLQECFASVLEYVKRELRPRHIVIGGRSMGGRAASMLAAQTCGADGLLLLAYPLHPAGRPDKLRASHLQAIAMPVLCLNGTRDALCRRDLMEDTLRTIGPNWRMHWIEGADHSFHVTRATGRPDADVLDEIGDVTRTWIDSAVLARHSTPGPRRPA